MVISRAIVQPMTPAGGGRDGQHEDSEQASSDNVCQPVRRLEQQANPHETATQSRMMPDPPASMWPRHQHSQAQADHESDHVTRREAAPCAAEQSVRIWTADRNLGHRGQRHGHHKDSADERRRSQRPSLDAVSRRECHQERNDNGWAQPLDDDVGSQLSCAPDVIRSRPVTDDRVEGVE